jgi:hypothetical protein
VPAQQHPTDGRSSGRLQRFTSAGAAHDLAALAEQSPARRTGGHRRTVSASDVPTDPTTPAPALHQLIGLEAATDLDRRFASLQPVRTKDGDGIHDWERDAAGKPLTHARRIALPDKQGRIPDLTSANFKDQIDLDALKRGEKRYIWAVGAPGRVFVGEEEPLGKDPQTGKERYRGHPLLVAGGPARICGDISHDAATDEFEVRDKSGRYSRYEDRTEPHLREVARLFAQAGLRVRISCVSGKAPEPLVLPSLDPDFKRGGDTGT